MSAIPELLCDRVQELVSAAIDGERSEEEVSAVSTHLDTCSKCRLFAERATALDEIAVLGEDFPAPNIGLGVLDSMEQRERRSQSHRWVAGAIVGGAVAAFVLVGMGTAVEDVERQASAVDLVSVEGVASAAPEGHDSAVFLELVNDGEGDRLVGARSSDAAAVELHGAWDAGSSCEMHHVGVHEVGSGEVALSEPCGNHVMLSGLLSTLRAGDEIEVVLLFERSDPVTVAVPVVDNPRPLDIQIADQ